jgi:hypothetical protein
MANRPAIVFDRRRTMEDTGGPAADRVYFAQRAAEELELALSAADREASEAHRKLQRVYTERASIGGRVTEIPEQVG